MSFVVDSKSILAFRLAVVANSICFIYFFLVLASLLPIQFLNVAWQVQLVKVLIENSTLPLAALAFLYLAAYLDPSNSQLRDHVKLLTSISCFVVVGFFLLIPLQGFATFNILNNIRQEEITRFDQALIRVRQFQKQVKFAGNYDQLSDVLKANQGFSLSENDRRADFSTTKSLLLQKIDQAKQLIRSNRSKDAFSAKALLQLQITARNWLLCLGYAIGFAALSQRAKAEGPLLQEFMAGFADFLEHRLHLRESNLQSRIDRENQAKQQFINDPDSHEIDLDHLQQRGLLDPRWISGEGEPSQSTTADPQAQQRFNQLPDSDIRPLTPPFEGGAKPSQGWFTRLGFRRQAPDQDYLDQLSFTSQADESQANSLGTGLEAGPGQAPSPSTSQPPSVSRGLGKRQGGPVDIGYFEELAGQSDENSKE